jgi:hypothetical protein
MAGDHEDDNQAARLRKPLSRSEAEAAWLRVSALGNPARTSAASSQAALEQRIREAAYFNSERRGFAPGCELEDWLAAEAALDA